jgi:hypothetical protein
MRLAFILGHLNNPTDISEICVVRHLKVSYDTIFKDQSYFLSFFESSFQFNGDANEEFHLGPM